MWSFCSLRYIISYTCVKWGHMRGMGGGWGWHRPWLAHRSNDGGPEKTLASVCCPGKQHAIIAGRGGRDMQGTHPHTHYTHPHIIHTHTIYTLWHEMLTLLSSSTSTILLRALYKNQKFDVCVCVCVHNAIIPYPEHFLFCGPSHVEQSPRASPTCTTQHARSAGNKTAPLLPSVPPCMGYQLSTSLVSEV